MFSERDILCQSFAEAYGWPPEVTLAQDPDYLDKDMMIREAKGKAANLRAIADRNRRGR